MPTATPHYTCGTISKYHTIIAMILSTIPHYEVLIITLKRYSRYETTIPSYQHGLNHALHRRRNDKTPGINLGLSLRRSWADLVGLLGLVFAVFLAGYGVRACKVKPYD